MIQRWRLSDPRWRRLLEPDASGELIALDCETTGLDPRRDEILSIAAIPILGRRILCARRLVLTVRPERAPAASSVLVHRLRPMDVAAGEPMAEALPKLLDFIGSRPLVGYFIAFDVRILSRYCRETIGIGLPNRMIEVSALYHRHRHAQAHWTGKPLDLRFETIRHDLGLPALPQHDAYFDALSAAMMQVTLADRMSGHAARD